MSSRVTCKGKRHGVRRVIVMRYWSMRLANANISVPSHGTDGHEHTAGEDPHHVSSEAVGRPISCDTRWIIVGHHVLEYATTYHHVTLSMNVSVRRLVGLHGQHHADVFLSRRRVAKIFTGFSKHSLVLLVIGSCRKEQWVLDDLAGRLSSRTRRMKGGNHVLVASRRHETLGFVLSVRTRGLHGQQNSHVFLSKKTAASVFMDFRRHSFVLLIFPKYDKVCDDVFLEERKLAPIANASSPLRSWSRLE